MLNAQEKEVYARTVARERLARMGAEKLLEEKSQELYTLNSDLQKTLSLHRREAFYLQSILDSAMDGILTISLDGKIDTANVSAGRIFDTTPNDLKGRDVRDLIIARAQEPPTIDNRFFSDICDERQPTIEATGIRCDGSKIELELSASYGEVDGDAVIIWVLRDISFLRTIKRQSDLNERMAGIGQLAAGIAHEINTPIQFVHENTKFFNDAFKALDQTLRIYEKYCETTPELKSAIEDACPSTQLEFFRDEIASALVETLAGTQRIAKRPSGLEIARKR
jgi:two-component system, NtrC family, sensor kinase